MKKQEAYKALELEVTASKEDAKKAFKKLAAKYHPDVNKDAGAIDSFKKINSAYQAIDQNKFDDQMPPNVGGWNPGGWHAPQQDWFDLHDFITGNVVRDFATRPKLFPNEDIHLEENITFKESILGSDKNITYKRRVKCDPCNGCGETRLNNGCLNCNGTGRVVNRTGNMVMTGTCNMCHGSMKVEVCKKCNGDAFTMTDMSINVKMPAGLNNLAVLRLAGIGHYVGGMVNYSSVLLKVRVEHIPGLSLVEKDVLTSVHISLLESFKGTTKEVETIDGKQEITIPPYHGNKDEITLPKLGVNREGNQRVVVYVHYPDNVDDLINALSSKEKN
jgi:molecular chaperone DnaJ